MHAYKELRLGQVTVLLRPPQSESSQRQEVGHV